MIKSILSTFVFVTAMSASAMPSDGLLPLISSLAQEQLNNALGLKVGDSANYNVDMGFIKGKMKSLVREEIDRGFWIQQDMDMGPFGKQKVEILMDKSTGQILELKVNGQNQQPPKQNMEVIETTEQKITVPAGTFDSLFVKMKNKDDGSVTQAWINPQEVPVGGMIKTIQPSQMGEVTVILTAFKKN